MARSLRFRQSDARSSASGALASVILLGLLLLASPITSMAQTPVAAMSGTVTDASGAVVIGAGILVTQEGTGAARVAVRNVVAHAGARRADVRLVRAGNSAELTITDDGKGFDIVGRRENGNGLGVVSINERVRLVGGTASITTELNKGTRVRVQVPAHQHAPTEASDESGRYAASA